MTVAPLHSDKANEGPDSVKCDTCGFVEYLAPATFLRALDEAIGVLAAGADEYSQRENIGAYVYARALGWRTGGVWDRGRWQDTDTCRLCFDAPHRAPVELPQPPDDETEVLSVDDIDDVPPRFRGWGGGPSGAV